MIDFYYAPTPNGWKISIMLEECGLQYQTHLVRIAEGDQFKPEFLKISPNAKMPAIVDKGTDGEPVSLFESGAILLYLAEKTGRFAPTDAAGRKELMEWIFWQVANQGPMAGQLSHFKNYAPKSARNYGFKRYLGEYERNLSVLEKRLEGREYILGEYSIADIISFPWVLIAKPLGSSLEKFPNVTAWRGRIKERPAVRLGVDLMKSKQNRCHDATNNNVLFNQSADSFK